MSKISNVLLFLQYLQNGRKYSISELAEKLEVSPRMIRVYKDELEKAGIFVDTIMGPYGGYILHQDLTIPPSFFTDEDYLFLKELDIPSDKKDYFSSIMSKIQRNVSSEKIEISDSMKDTYNILSRAIKEKRKVKITYISYKDGSKERIIHPLHLFYYSTGWGCAAYCELRCDLRHFELSRIVDIKLLTDTF